MAKTKDTVADIDTPDPFVPALGPVPADHTPQDDLWAGPRIDAARAAATAAGVPAGEPIPTDHLLEAGFTELEASVGVQM